jgi:alpha-L-arabinofuranosidase
VKTPLFHLFKQYGEWMQGEALATKVDCSTIQPPPPKAHYPKFKTPADYHPPESSYLDAAAAVRENTLAIALVNRHATDIAEVKLNLPRGYVPQKVWTLHHDDIFAANNFNNPYRVVPTMRPVKGKKWNCPPHSVSLILCEKEK